MRTPPPRPPRHTVQESFHEHVDPGTGNESLVM